MCIELPCGTCLRSGPQDDLTWLIMSVPFETLNAFEIDKMIVPYLPVQGARLENVQFLFAVRHERPSKRKNWQDHSTIISGRLKFLDVRIQRFQPLNGHLGSSQPQRLMPPRRPRPRSAGTRSHRSNRSNWGGPSEDGHKGQEGRGSHRFPSHQSNHDEESEEMSMSAQRPGPRHGQGPDGPGRRRQIFEELWNRLVRPLGDDVSWSIVWKLSWLLCLLSLLCVLCESMCGWLGLLASVCTADSAWPLDCAGSCCLPLYALLKLMATAITRDCFGDKCHTWITKRNYHLLKVVMLVSARFCKMVCSWIKPHSIGAVAKYTKQRLALLVLGSLRTDLTSYRSYRTLTKNDTSKIVSAWSW